MTLLEIYLTHLTAFRSATTGETSHYTALETYLNRLGETLKPKVKANAHPRNTGAGIPDLGLFDETQPDDTKPAFGVVEVKGLSQDLTALANSEQVAKYAAHYGSVLVTNYYQFTLVTRGPNGQPTREETYALAPSLDAFWEAMQHPRAFAARHEQPLREYLLRAMRRAAPLAEPRDVAWLLASYARVAKAILDMAGDLEALTLIRADLENALAFKFDEVRGNQFFRSALIQTLFYGIFSAWVNWHDSRPAAGAHFDLWRDTRSGNKPVIGALFYQLTNPARLKQLGLDAVLDWTAAALNRVDRATFFSLFETGHAIQYFYEPFLEAFDPDLRNELGVWYTPPEIVAYMVARVDTALQTELGIEDGLADENVVVLDPACGTGAYLLAVARHIYERVKRRRGVQAAAQATLKALKSRIFGFEILPAPFVIAHLQIDLLLKSWGAAFADPDRAAVYLTNALTGWGATKEAPKNLMMQEIAQESAAALKVKQEGKILVVIGNPPYNAFAGTSSAAEDGAVEVYKVGLRETWGIRKFNLDDLYIRFFRTAELCVTELSSLTKGIVCYISPFSYLDRPSYVVMRERFLKSFHRLWFDNLNGDSRETGKVIPKGLPNEGKPDPSVFSTPFSAEGIRVGTAIGLLVRKPDPTPAPEVFYREFWGATKRADLLASLADPDFNQHYQRLTPAPENRYALRPMHVRADYKAWPKLTDLAAILPFNGLLEMRGNALISIDRESLHNRMAQYYDPAVTWEALSALQTGLTKPAARFDPQRTRQQVLQTEKFSPDRIRRYAVRPFDTRWCYYSPVRPLWNETRPLLWEQQWEGNEFLVSRPQGVADNEGVPFDFTRQLGDYDALRGHARYIPFRLRQQTAATPQDRALGKLPEPTYRANLSEKARAYLARLGFTAPDGDPAQAALIWLHALAIGYAPDYLTDHADGIRADYPRIPLPENADLLQQSAALGREVAALLDTEKPVRGVTAGDPRPELVGLAEIRSVGALSYKLSAGWGRLNGGAVMPGPGRKAENADGTLNIYLNETTYWANIPQAVWEYTIGGYQVIKKWLSYREFGVLGRALTPEEADEVTDIARRIAALIGLEDRLNENYAACSRASATLK